jgi:hypothetical protein
VISYTKAVKHSITLEPGTAPISTRPYTLPEDQRAETEKQVARLSNEGITEDSKPPWTSGRERGDKVQASGGFF